MKTPRDLLLQRHQSAEHKLDALRADALSALNPTDYHRATALVTPATLILTLWRELVLPSRKTWVGLAAVWIVLLLLHWAGPGRGQSLPMAKSSAARPEMFLALREQQRVLAEILSPGTVPEPAATPRHDLPAPHTERRLALRFV